MAACIARRAAHAWLGGVVLAATACGADLRVSVRDLEISPNPAQAGQVVTFSFELIVVPEQRFMLTTLIDGVQHTRDTLSALQDGPFAVAAGDAADLIARYGLGPHEGAVEVRLDDGGRTATASRTFVLQEPPPPRGTGCVGSCTAGVPGTGR